MNPSKREGEIHDKDFTTRTTKVNGHPTSYTKWSIENLNTHKWWIFMPSKEKRQQPYIKGLKVLIFFPKKSGRDKRVNTTRSYVY